MAHEGVKEIWRSHRAGQDKYTYFLLAVAASAVAFAVQKTEGLSLSWSLTPVALAVVCWGSSFYCGCKNLIWVQTTLLANYSLLQLQEGSHPNQPDQPELLEAAIAGVRSAVDSNISAAQAYGIWQFRFLLIGAGFFLIWHIWKLYAASLSA